jgi:hypothetical protein
LSDGFYYLETGAVRQFLFVHSSDLCSHIWRLALCGTSILMDHLRLHDQGCALI